MSDDKKLLFVVDDDEDLRSSLEDYFNSQGFEVKAIEDGLAVLSQCHTLLPDLIISDIKMPNLDGVSLMNELKKREETKNIPVIFMSAYYDDGVMMKAKKLGAEDFIFKPFEVGRLEKMINRTFSKKSN